MRVSLVVDSDSTNRIHYPEIWLTSFIRLIIVLQSKGIFFYLMAFPRLRAIIYKMLLVKKKKNYAEMFFISVTIDECLFFYKPHFIFRSLFCFYYYWTTIGILINYTICSFMFNKFSTGIIKIKLLCFSLIVETWNMLILLKITYNFWSFEILRKQNAQILFAYKENLHLFFINFRL